jgi:hypothetical protein
MDGFSLLDPLAWQPEHLADHPLYAVGHALGCLARTGQKHAAPAGTDHLLSGRLYLSKSGWLLLSVPNALVRGVYDAMSEPGVELPTAGSMNVPNMPGELLNAHISVMTAAEVSSIGADKINERGHMFRYSLGPMKEITPKNIDGISKVWALQVAAPGLVALRKSYGLPGLPNGDRPLHITVAVRKRGVLLDNGVAKGYETSAETTEGQRFRNPISRGELKAAANLSRAGTKDLLPGGEADNVPDREFPRAALAKGQKHEHEHTDNDQIAKEIAKDHLSEDPRYYEKVEQIESATKPEKTSTDSVYAQQFKNLLNFRQPIVYDHNKPVYQNVVDHLRKAQERADFILASRQREHIYRTQLDPRYRYQMAQMAIHGTLPRMNPADKAMQLYGNDAFDSVTNILGKGFKKNG